MASGAAVASGAAGASVAAGASGAAVGSAAGAAAPPQATTKKAITSSAVRVLKRNFIVVSFDINLCHIAMSSPIYPYHHHNQDHNNISVATINLIIMLLNR